MHQYCSFLTAIRGQGSSWENDSSSWPRAMSSGSYKPMSSLSNTFHQLFQRKELWLWDGSLGNQTWPQTCSYIKIRFSKNRNHMTASQSGNPLYHPADKPHYTKQGQFLLQQFNATPPKKKQKKTGCFQCIWFVILLVDGSNCMHILHAPVMPLHCSSNYARCGQSACIMTH